MNVRRVGSVASTQDLVAADDPEWTVVAADEQTAGRGRRGRAWIAPPGTAILASVLLKPPAGRRLPELSLVAGLAVADTVEEALGREAAIKWPNDVLVDGEKIAGVLAEAREGAVVVGIGLNVSQTRDELPAGATSLHSADGATRERDELLERLLAHLRRRYDAWLASGLALDDLRARDALRGQRVSVGGVEGTAAGIDELGRLLVDAGGERRPVESGEVAGEA